MRVEAVECRSILTRTGGYLADVSSHSVNPYIGCGLGRSLCGVGCYAQHNRWLTRGAPWGSVVTAKINAADVYRRTYEKEKRWAGRLRLFLASSTEPFQPAEKRFGVTCRLLEAMVELPPEELVVQTHSPRVVEVLPTLVALHARCQLRVHVSIESDRDTLPGLPRPAATVASRLRACQALRDADLRVVATIAPLLPIEDPRRFFTQLGAVCSEVVIDHFIGGDGSVDGARTKRTPLPLAMAAVEPGSVTPEYRRRMLDVAMEILGPSRVGVGQRGFAGERLDATGRVSA